MSRKTKATGGTPATAALTVAGVAFRLHSYAHDPQSTSFGDEAARELGVDPARIFKTLVVETDSTSLAVAVVPVALHLDLKAMAQASGAKRVQLAERSAAERSSGYVIGGISPIGQRRALPTVIDATAQEFETIMVSAGKRGLQVELAPADLARITGAGFAPIGTR